MNEQKKVESIEQIEKTIEQLKEHNIDGDYTEQIEQLEAKLKQQKIETYSSLSPWETVQIARNPKRPVLQDYIANIFTDWIELHGDRSSFDDNALIGGFATLGDEKVMLIGHNKGKNVKENIERNFGSARPEGYRKALRIMKLAEKYQLPIISLIDTAGAYPGLEGEAHGQGEAIARNLVEMAHLEVPIIVLVTGEGGSGGALGIGVGDVVLMMEHAMYSVISPEGCASILWRDASFASKAAEAMKITSKSLKKLGIVDDIIKEPVGGAHTDPHAMMEEVKRVILSFLKKLKKSPSSKLVHKRFEKFSKMGKYNS